MGDAEVKGAANMWDLLSDNDPGHVIGAPPETKAKKRCRSKSKKNKKAEEATTAAAEEEEEADVDGEVVVTAGGGEEKKEEAAPAPAPAPKAMDAREAQLWDDELHEQLRLMKLKCGIPEPDPCPCLPSLGEVLRLIVAAGLGAFFYSVLTTASPAAHLNL
uniref:Uncharacterized protein n=1 Tax=Leersia perrieri TaxID=77586 RepID=A0A0D9W1B5_9ORYZ